LGDYVCHSDFRFIKDNKIATVICIDNCDKTWECMGLKYVMISGEDVLRNTQVILASVNETAVFVCKY
jgi:hypothetical protein